MPTDLEKQAQEIAALTTGAPARRIRGAGGTPGGVGTFLIGLAMVVCGGWLVLNQVQVTSSYSFFGLWGWSRPGGFGLTLLPMLGHEATNSDLWVRRCGHEAETSRRQARG